MMMPFAVSEDQVGPVLAATATARDIVAAIKLTNSDVTIIDRGGYLRVLVRRECILKRETMETLTGQAFQLPGALEAVMPSFKGRFIVSSDEAKWVAV